MLQKKISSLLRKKIRQLLLSLGLLPIIVIIKKFLYLFIFYKKIQIVWMDEAKDYELAVLSYGQTGIASNPIFYRRVNNIIEIALPNVIVCVFRNARISLVSSSVVMDENKIIIERILAPDQKIVNYSSGHIVDHSQEFAYVKRYLSSISTEKGIAIFGNGASNYYHWIIEILPKLQFVDELPEEYRSYPLLVSDEILKIPSMEYALNLFRNGREVIYLDSKKVNIINDLVWITSPNNLPFNLRRNNKFKTNYTKINKKTLNYVRTVAFSHALVGHVEKNYFDKIFFSRKTERRNYNQDEVYECLSRHGFVKIFMEDLSFVEQVRTVYNAQIIVGPTGAAWTNLIFCRPGTKALCWMAEEIGDFSAFSTIAWLYDVDLRYITYKADVIYVSDLYQKDYKIDVCEIEKHIQEINNNSLSIRS